MSFTPITFIEIVFVIRSLKRSHLCVGKTLGETLWNTCLIFKPSIVTMIIVDGSFVFDVLCSVWTFVIFTARGLVILVCYTSENTVLVSHFSYNETTQLSLLNFKVLKRWKSVSYKFYALRLGYIAMIFKLWSMVSCLNPYWVYQQVISCFCIWKQLVTSCVNYYYVYISRYIHLNTMSFILW